MLEEHYIEARLHTDGETNIDRILALQAELAQSVATPYYLIQDPKSKRLLGAPVGGVTTVETFRELLQAAVDARERVGRLDAR